MTAGRSLLCAPAVLLALVIGGCGGSTARPATVGTAMRAALARHLADARAAAAGGNRTAAAAALDAVSADIGVIAARGSLAPARIAGLRRLVAQARGRTLVDLPAPAPPAHVAAIAPAVAPAPTAVGTPEAGPAAAPSVPRGGGSGGGNGHDKHAGGDKGGNGHGHGDGNGNGNGGGGGGD